jgi:para-aminobenzoate synthetase/4-amino-4-deoxychorismate lyase
LREVEAWATAGGVAVGYVAYDASRAFDPAFPLTAPRTELPLAQFRFVRSLAPATPLPETLAEASGDPAGDRLSWSLDTGPEAHGRALGKIRRAIARGDTYQVNFTIRAGAAFQGDPAALFRDLWRAQPVPYAARLDFGRWVVCSLSPELFFDLDGERIVCRPMKGTARRGPWPERDREIAAALRASDKERAENLMIVDMVRNDLGRIARPGSVVTSSLFDLERYASVWQMTSTVEARTDAPLPEIFRALFPSASVTGAPKIRATELIARLETSPRGLYTGAVGFVGPGRRARFNVAIRTAVVDREEGAAEYGVGGGIVWDSVAAAEYQECRAKARVLERAPDDFDLLETILWRPAQGPWLWGGHLRRLRHSAEYFDFPEPEAQSLLAALEEAARDAGPGPVVLRLLWSRAGEARVGTGPAVGEPPPGTLRVAWARAPVDPEEPRIYHKTSDRRLYDRARSDRPGFADVLLWNPEGFATETTIGNLVVETAAGEMLTPPIEHGLLAGVYREALLERGAVREEPLRCEEVTGAARVWRVNSVRGWTELRVEVSDTA